MEDNDGDDDAGNNVDVDAEVIHFRITQDL